MSGAYADLQIGNIKLIRGETLGSGSDAIVYRALDVYSGQV